MTNKCLKCGEELDKSRKRWCNKCLNITAIMPNCRRCGKVLRNLRGKWCDDCRPDVIKEYQRDYDRTRRARCKEFGVCIKCNSESGGETLCRSCREKENNKASNRYRLTVESNLCVICKKVLKETETRMCSECRPVRNEKVRDLNKKRRETRAEQGSCYGCKEKLDYNSVNCKYCEKCRMANRGKSHSRYLRNKERISKLSPEDQARLMEENKKALRDRYQKRKEEGRCVRCGRDEVHGRSYCEKCLTYQMGSFERWAAKKRKELGLE